MVMGQGVKVFRVPKRVVCCALCGAPVNPLFNRCAGCGRWVCLDCYWSPDQMCNDCGPVLVDDL